MLSRQNIKCVDLQPRKVPIPLLPIKGNLGLETPGVYSVSCECGPDYIGQTGRSIETEVKEHQRHIRRSIQINWPWLNTAKVRAIVSNSKTQVSYPQNPETWTGWYGRAHRSSCTLTTWTVRMVSFCRSWKPPNPLSLSLEESRKSTPRKEWLSRHVLLRTRTFLH
jgi:hypothetical protein